MSTSDYELHRAIVHSSNVLTGAAEVRIPSLLGAGQLVNVPTTGLTQTAGEWNVPVEGSSVFVAVSTDRTQFLWVTAVTAPTDSDIDFNDNVTIGGDLDVSGNETVGGDLTVSGDVYFNNNALIASYGGSTNIDHIWHSDSPDNSFPGTWHFVSDREYKEPGSSMIQAGGMRIPTRCGYTGTANITIDSDFYGGSYIEMTSSSARTVTLTPPTTASDVTIPVGTTITVIRYGAGAVSFAAGTNTDGLTTTIRSRNGDLSLAYRYSAATLICRNGNGADWYLVGDLT